MPAADPVGKNFLASSLIFTIRATNHPPTLLFAIVKLPATVGKTIAAC